MIFTFNIFLSIYLLVEFSRTHTVLYILTRIILEFKAIFINQNIKLVLCSIHMWKVPHRLRYLNTWSKAGGSVWSDSGRYSLAEETMSLGQVLRSHGLTPLPVYFLGFCLPCSGCLLPFLPCHGLPGTMCQNKPFPVLCHSHRDSN